MSEQDPNERRDIETGGGAYLEGEVQTGGGDIIGRDKVTKGDEVRGDKYVQYYQLDVAKLLDTLQRSLPDNDPTPQHLMETLQRFQFFHTRLFEWKELHNYLNDITFTLAQFSREVERLDATGEAPNFRGLSRLWRPITNKVAVLLEWAAGVEHISETPFTRLAEGMQGPPWAIEPLVAQTRIDELLEAAGQRSDDLYDATFDFVDIVERHMYLADKKLRETAGELFTLSSVVLGSLSRDR